MFGGVHFSFYKPLLKKSSKIDFFVQICPDAFWGLGVFPLKKRGNGPYRVDSSSFKSKVGDCQGTKILEKIIAIQKIEKLDILASIQNSRGIRWYSVVTHQSNLKTQNVRTIKSWKKTQRYRRQKSQTSWHQYKTAGEIGRALLVVHQLSLLHEWPI